MGLQLRLRELYARDETNSLGTEWGSDDMYVGAVGLELRGPQAKPTVHKVAPFKVGVFDDGDRKVFNPPRLFDNFGFGPGVWPKSITETIFIAERDKGADLSKYYDSLCVEYDKKSNEIKADMATNGSPQTNQEKLEQAIKIAKAIFEISKKIYSQWKGDEIFSPQVVSFRVESEQHTWRGAATSPEEVLHYEGHGGHYILKYDLKMQADH